MRKDILFFAVVGATLLCGLTLTGIAAATPADNATDAANATNESSEVWTGGTQEIDDRTRITEWEYHEGSETFEITVEADRQTRLTLTEAVQFEEGAGTIAIEQQPIPSGETTFTMRVPMRADQAGLVITSSRSIDAGTGTYLSTGQTETDRPSIAWGSVQLIIVGVGLLSVGATIRVVKKKREDEQLDCERIL